MYFVELRRRTGATIQLLPEADSSRDPAVVDTLRRARSFLRGDVGRFEHEKGLSAFEVAVLLFGLAVGALGFVFARTAVRRARRGGTAGDALAG